MPKDKYVIDLEEYFHSPRFMKKAEEERWGLLSPEEVSLIAEEIDRCQGDFLHTARNWFMIADKAGRPQTFDLWDGQLLVVEKLKDMQSRGKAQQIVVIKSRQLGLSQLGCALACWRAFFNDNLNAKIISEDDKKTVNLWNDYTLPVYRQLPWFMRPIAMSLSIKEGIVLDTDPKKTNRIGLRSKILIEPASSSGYVGQGTRLNFFHGSEFTSWPAFSDIIERGLEQALFDDPSTIGILESTAKGAGTTTHTFWNRMNRLGDQARWETLFLPFFMDKTHVLAPHKGWVLSDKEKKRREAVEANWVRCDNRDCKKYFNRMYQMRDLCDTKCKFCKTGIFRPYLISDEQLYWMSSREASASDPKIIQQEQAITAEEAFLVMGDKVFSDAAIEYATYTADKCKNHVPYRGFFDSNGRFHGFKDGSNGECACNGCNVKPHKELRDLKVWDMPQAGSEYYIGADVAEGLGKDYSVFFVMKKGNGTPDLHVATYRERLTNPYNLAYRLNPLGRWYNNAQIAVEYTGSGSSTADTLLNTLNYPNVYRRKGSGDFSRTLGQGFHWTTNVGTKSKLISFMERWLTDEMLVIRDMDLVEELKVYVRKEENSKKVGNASGNGLGEDFHDDYLMAAMICVYTAHQLDFDEHGGITPFKIDPTPENQPYIVSCNTCGTKVGISHPMHYRKCVKCNSMQLYAIRNFNIALPDTQNPHRDIISGDSEAFDGATFGPEFDDKPYLSYW